MLKSFFSHFTSILIIALIFLAVFWALDQGKQEKAESLSPVPEFLDLSKNDQVRLLDLWFPVEKSYGSKPSISNLSAKSALIYDMSLNKPLFEKDPKKRLPMASLTKIMTAIIALENPDPDDKYEVSRISLVGEDSMGVSEGEVLGLEDLLYGLMLSSGNDAAEVLADNYAYGRESFIKAMNDKAKALGLSNTRFANPSGLQGDGAQYSTTYDLLVITRYALENFPLFAKIVATPSIYIPEGNFHRSFSLANETNLLTSYPGVKGVKTGYTPEAGLCLVTYLDYKDHKMIGVILNSQNRRGEMKELLDHSLKQVGITPPEYNKEGN